MDHPQDRDSFALYPHLTKISDLNACLAHPSLRARLPCTARPSQSLESKWVQGLYPDLTETRIRI